MTTDLVSLSTVGGTIGTDTSAGCADVDGYVCRKNGLMQCEGRYHTTSYGIYEDCTETLKPCGGKKRERPHNTTYTPPHYQTEKRGKVVQQYVRTAVATTVLVSLPAGTAICHCSKKNRDAPGTIYTLHVVRRPCQSWLGFLAGGVCLTPLVTRRLAPCPTLGCLSSLSFSSLSLGTASSRLLLLTAHHGVLERLEVRPYVEHLGIPSSVSRGNQERADRHAK